MHKLITLGMVLGLVATSAWAQETMQNGDTPLQPPAREVPPLPGDTSLEAGQEPPEVDQQTPTEQESIVPRDDPQPEDEPDPALLERQEQPEFSRDATPRSTEEERETQRNILPAPSQGDATGGAQPDIVPLPEDEHAPGEDPTLPPVNPNEIPDRRFETFETEYKGGTPPLDVPAQRPKQKGAAPERAPL